MKTYVKINKEKEVLARVIVNDDEKVSKDWVLVPDCPTKLFDNFPMRGAPLYVVSDGKVKVK